LQKHKNNILFLTYAAVIAALYTVLTLVSGVFGLSGGMIQVRISEMLTVLPYFTPAAIPGLFVGCIISNMLTGAMVLDTVFGSIATLIGAIFTYLLRKKSPRFAPIPPIAANTLIIPLVLKSVYGLEDGLPFIYISIFAGEFISCGILGFILLVQLKKHYPNLFVGK